MFSPRLLQLASLSALTASLALPAFFAKPVYAIPKDAAIQKLNTLTAFVIVKSEDEFVFAQQGDTKLVSVFMDKESAESMLKAFKRNDSTFKADIKKYSLDQLFPLIEQSSAQSAAGNPELLFAIMNNSSNIDIASSILRKEGYSKKVIKESLRVPVFFTEPMINLDLKDIGKRQIFFLNYNTIKNLLSELPAGVRKPKIKVLNLDQVIELIMENPKDVFYIYPNQ